MEMKEQLPWRRRKNDLFADAGAQAKADFFAASECIELRRGQHVFRARDAAARVFYLQIGRAKVYDISPQGVVTIFWYCSAGHLLGPGALAGAMHQAVNAQMVEPGVVFALRREALETVLRAHPQLAINLVRGVAAYLRTASDMAVDRTCLRAGQRLARILLRLGSTAGTQSLDGSSLSIAVSHEELGCMVGSSRQTVNRILGAFQDEGLVEVKRRVLTIKSWDRLEQLAQA